MTNDSTQSLPSTVTDLMERIKHEWSALLDAVEDISDEQMCRRGSGGWSVKDTLAHISAWEKFLLLNQFQGHPAHEVLQVNKSTLARASFDELNANLFEHNQGRLVADILAGLEESHAQLLAALERISDDDLIQPIRAIGTKERPLSLWLKWVTYHHYKEHRKMIQDILNE
jgi:hypothetical protein